MFPILSERLMSASTSSPSPLDSLALEDGTLSSPSIESSISSAEPEKPSPPHDRRSLVSR